MRPAIEVWRDAQDAWFGLAWEQPDINRAMRVIEADRAEARAELVAEIVAWLRHQEDVGFLSAAFAIEAKFGGRDG